MVQFSSSTELKLASGQPTVVDVPLDGPPVPRFPEVTRNVRTNGLRFILLPPGQTTVNYKTSVSFLDVNLSRLKHRIAVNSDRLRDEMVAADSLGFVPIGSDFKISVTNPLPGLLVEIEPDYWPDTLREAFAFAEDGPGLGGDGARAGRTSSAVDFLMYKHDPIAAELGKAGIRLLMEEHNTDEKADALALEGIALGLLGRVAKRIADDRSEAFVGTHSGALGRHKLRLVTEFVEANLHDTIQVADLAQLVAMSVSHFARSFKDVMDVTPARYVVLRRVARAKLLLAQKELPIAEIAFFCGFSGPAHLTRMFRAVAGTTPAAFRKEVV